MPIPPPTPLLLALTCSVLALACGQDDVGPPARPSDGETLTTEQQNPKIPQRTVDPSTTGTLVVLVTLAGDPPEPRKLDIGREAACEHDELYSEAVIQLEGKLSNALVRVIAGHEQWLPPETSQPPAQLRQAGCVYRPHVLAIRVGRMLLVENEDSVLHNVHVRARRNAASNRVQTATGPSLELQFFKPELSIPIQCDIHPWMGAWLHVLEHPWFAVTDESGRASITGLPPGEYDVEVRHEKFGRMKIHCSITTGNTTEIRSAFQL